MSPMICSVSAMLPSHASDWADGDGGTTSATGLPNRVMRIGFLVLCTCSSSAKHLALIARLGSFPLSVSRFSHCPNYAAMVN
jgi:hypothetical protein